MTTPIHNYNWPQGADLTLGFRCLSGDQPVDLEGYSVRMDMVNPTTGAVLFTFNTAEQDNEDEIFVNAGGTGRIVIRVPRTLTLPSGAGESPTPVYAAIQEGQFVFSYDVFLRDPDNRQSKVYGGTITVEPSHTLWR